jgi:hypothetical protein
MTKDQRHIQRIRSAATKLLRARNYQAAATKLVREAERELEAAIDEAAPKKEAA